MSVATAATTVNWSQANQRYLLASIREVQQELENYFAERQQGQANFGQANNSKSLAIQQELKEASAALPMPAALQRLATVFRLSNFERKIILMCVGVELDANFSALIKSINGDSATVYPSFSLALAALSEAHWSAVAPQSPLRYWRLVEITNRALLTKSALKIDEAILHYITGVQYLDERLSDLVERVEKKNQLIPSQEEIRDTLIVACAPQTHSTELPILQLKGENQPDKINIAADVCGNLGFHMYTLAIDTIPSNANDNLELIRRWNREAAMKSCALFLDCNALNPGDKTVNQALAYFIDRVQGLLIISISEHSPAIKRFKIEAQVPKPTPREQLGLWQLGLGEEGKQLNTALSNVVTQFNLSAQDIYSISHDLCLQNKMSSTVEGKTENTIEKNIWKACCNHTRPKLDELIERIEPVANWDNIVLPPTQKQILEQVAIQVKQRNKVYYDWGFSKMGARGLGISALFAGESGTGKTMASEVLANELQLDLYKIDLSQVVNKYIGETEKNLKRIFDAAEEGGAILLFDEADALFGKRSDVKDSHDRYSNIEVSYLLQRMEAYRGLAILTTNMKSAIDKAFMRRIRFVIQFSYPDQQHRAEIWRKVFPAETPQQNLDFEKLSRLNVPGGNIRNIALNAAFVAAEENCPVQMHHILKAARAEYSKLEKTMSTYEIKGWS